MYFAGVENGLLGKFVFFNRFRKFWMFPQWDLCTHFVLLPMAIVSFRFKRK